MNTGTKRIVSLAAAVLVMIASGVAIRRMKVEVPNEDNITTLIVRADGDIESIYPGYVYRRGSGEGMIGIRWNCQQTMYGSWWMWARVRNQLFVGQHGLTAPVAVSPEKLVQHLHSRGALLKVFTVESVRQALQVGAVEVFSPHPRLYAGLIWRMVLLGASVSAAAAIYGLVRSLRNQRRLAKNLCPTCAYPLAKGTCSECGFGGRRP